MKRVRITCPECESEIEYILGVTEECPKCGTEMGLIPEDDFENYPEEDEDIDEQFIQLQSLNEPYFTLKHGKLYKCKWHIFKNDEVIEEIAFIVPLAFEKDRNRFFVLHLPNEAFYYDNPKAMSDFAKMDFATIWNDGIRHYFDDFFKNPPTTLCATTENNTIIDNDTWMTDFEEVSY